MGKTIIKSVNLDMGTRTEVSLGDTLFTFTFKGYIQNTAVIKVAPVVGEGLKLFNSHISCDLYMQCGYNHLLADGALVIMPERRDASRCKVHLEYTSKQ